MPFLDNSTLAIPSRNIITSSTHPSNPQIGDIWNELDAENFLIYKWNYQLNNGWTSDILIKDFYEHNGALRASMILDYRYDYLVRDFGSVMATTTTMTSSQAWTIRFGHGRIDDMYINQTANRLASASFTNQLANTTIRKLAKINRKIITSPISSNTPSHYLIGVEVVQSGGFTPLFSKCFMNYQLIRK